MKIDNFALHLHNFDVWNFVKCENFANGEVYLKHTRELSKYAADEEAKLSLAIAADKAQNYQIVQINFKLKTSLKLQCQRCLEDFIWHYERDFTYPVFSSENQAKNTQFSADDYLVCALGEKFDLLWFVEEEIILAMPMIAKHEDCSIDFKINSEVKNSALDNASPFAALKQLLNKEN